jgi:hypothetical protein
MTWAFGTVQRDLLEDMLRILAGPPPVDAVQIG